MAETIYAVHTRKCTYLVDDEGICRWVLPPVGAPTAEVRRCVGAQFVASLDPREPGGLAGELRVGASALFVVNEGGRIMLLRTAPVARVEIRAASDPPPYERTEAASLPTVAPLPGSASAPRDPLDASGSSDADGTDALEVDPDDVIEVEDGAVTLTIPLYRGESPAPRGGRG